MAKYQLFNEDAELALEGILSDYNPIKVAKKAHKKLIAQLKANTSRRAEARNSNVRLKAIKLVKKHNVDPSGSYGKVRVQAPVNFNGDSLYDACWAIDVLFDRHIATIQNTLGDFVKVINELIATKTINKVLLSQVDTQFKAVNDAAYEFNDTYFKGDGEELIPLGYLVSSNSELEHILEWRTVINKESLLSSIVEIEKYQKSVVGKLKVVGKILNDTDEYDGTATVTNVVNQLINTLDNASTALQQYGVIVNQYRYMNDSIMSIANRIEADY